MNKETEGKRVTNRRSWLTCWLLGERDGWSGLTNGRTLFISAYGRIGKDASRSCVCVYKLRILATSSFRQNEGCYFIRQPWNWCSSSGRISAARLTVSSFSFTSKCGGRESQKKLMLNTVKKNRDNAKVQNIWLVTKEERFSVIPISNKRFPPLQVIPPNIPVYFSRTRNTFWNNYCSTWLKWNVLLLLELKTSGTKLRKNL